jgi:hypothetical protein
MQPIFYPQSGICILAVQTGQLHGNIPEFETFEMQKLDDVTLLEFDRSDILQSFTIYIVVLPAISSREDPRFSSNPWIPRSY